MLEYCIYIYIYIYCTCRVFGITFNLYRIGGVIVSILALSVVDRGFEPRSGQSKDYKSGICCFSAKHAALRRKSKNWLARNHNNVEGHVYPWAGVSVS
jgi:hypothetical protein